MGIAMNNLLLMLQSIDAFFPVGTFTLSNGLETYVQQGKIKNECDLEQYLCCFLETFPFNDLGLMFHAYNSANDANKISMIDNIATAIKIPKEIRAGSNKTGIRLLKAIKHIGNDCPSLNLYQDIIKNGKAKGYHSVALGLYANDINMDINQALEMYTYSTCSAIVNNSVKLVPLSQMGGQKVLSKTITSIDRVIEAAKNTEITDLGRASMTYDILCMQHEKLYYRLYIS